ncbi:hypothetical protein AR1Y2_2853 [Anaerostipes rhamnosivorans]|uniref:Uncharacterized protein n=1 Tax=Anaerostipes rhamnosivorans TaxID=1229621 RepID=A0A4P8IHL4_9FIRM|nr:hypothetical protein AR1Y2_2853 [Anaerostipes rhamnosivorans]
MFVSIGHSHLLHIHISQNSPDAIHMPFPLSTCPILVKGAVPICN